jgi:glycosyltransferase involved in cell wall biosynthesis
LWEGLPNVILESLATGRPVLLSEAANAASVIEDGRTGWIVRTGDVEQLAQALARALVQPEALRANCIAAAQPFAMETMVASYSALYERLSASPSA